MKKTHVNTCPIPKGTLLIIGGKEDKEVIDKNEEADHKDEGQNILQNFIALVNKDDIVLEVVTTATSSPEETFADYKKVFSEMNIKELGQIHHTSRDEIMGDEMDDRIRNADAIFFTGGDQLQLTSIYGGTSFLRIIKERYIHEKLVIGGTSAGAMAMSTPMIFAGNKEVQQTAGEIKITVGLEFLKDVCIDTHFIDRSRFIRMAQVIATNPTCIGIGIEEDTAIIVKEGSKAEVVGSGIVTIIEGFNATMTNITEFSKEEMFNIRDLKVHLLSKGNEYQIPQINPPHL